MDDGRTIILGQQKRIKNFVFIDELANLGAFEGYFIAAECESGRGFSEYKPCDSDLFAPDSDFFRTDSRLFSRESPGKSCSRA